MFPRALYLNAAGWAHLLVFGYDISAGLMYAKLGRELGYTPAPVV